MDIREEFRTEAKDADLNAARQSGYAAGIRQGWAMMDAWLGKDAGDGVPDNIVKLPVSEPLTAERIEAKDNRTPVMRSYDLGYEAGYAKGETAGKLAINDKVADEALATLPREGVGSPTWREGYDAGWADRARLAAADADADFHPDCVIRCQEALREERAQLPATRHPDCADFCQRAMEDCGKRCQLSERARKAEADVNAGARDFAAILEGEGNVAVSQEE